MVVFEQQFSEYQDVYCGVPRGSVLDPSSFLLFINDVSNFTTALQWRHNGHDSVANHQPDDCLLNCLFRRRSKKTSKLRVTGLCVGNSPGPVNSPHKWPVTRKMFPFDDVIMNGCVLIMYAGEDVMIYTSTSTS